MLRQILDFSPSPILNNRSQKCRNKLSHKISHKIENTSYTRLKWVLVSSMSSGSFDSEFEPAADSRKGTDGKTSRYHLSLLEDFSKAVLILQSEPVDDRCFTPVQGP